LSAQLLAGLRAIRPAPLTIVYLIVLSATTAVLSLSSPAHAEQLLLSFSTNLHELAHVPLRVLIGSAFWTEGWGDLATWVALFVVIVAPVERHVGWRRTLIVLASGHLGATLLVAAGLTIALHFGTVAPTVVDAQDVGASYAFFAVAAFAGYLLGPRERLVYFGVLGSYLVSGALQTHTFTDFGHLTAIAIGLACRPLAGASGRSGYGWLAGGGAPHRDIGFEPEQVFFSAGSADRSTRWGSSAIRRAGTARPSLGATIHTYSTRSTPGAATSVP
jgi:hypothetical protein